MPKAIWIGYRFDLKGSITNESGGLSSRVYLIQFEYTSRPVKTLEVCVEALKGAMKWPDRRKSKTAEINKNKYVR